MAILDTTTFAEVDLVKVEKSARTMTLFDGEVVVNRFVVSLGPYPQGHKQQEGDGKTPEGEYTLDYKKEDSSFYRAMHISYPNAQDIANAKSRGVSPGGYIMVHGQRNGASDDAFDGQNRDWTQGCNALSNAEMDEFIDAVKVGTKIFIS